MDKKRELQGLLWIHQTYIFCINLWTDDYPSGQSARKKEKYAQFSILLPAPWAVHQDTRFLEVLHTTRFPKPK